MNWQHVKKVILLSLQVVSLWFQLQYLRLQNWRKQRLVERNNQRIQELERQLKHG